MIYSTKQLSLPDQVHLKTTRYPETLNMSYLLWGWRRLHVALRRRRCLHDGLRGRGWWRRRVRVGGCRLVSGGWRGHDVAGLWRGVLGQHGWRRRVQAGRLWGLAGALATERHLPETWSQLISLKKEKERERECILKEMTKEAT